MQKNQQEFYRPYVDSEDESDGGTTDTDTDTESVASEHSGAIRIGTTVSQQLENQIPKRLGFSQFDTKGTYDTTLPFTGTTLNLTDSTYTTILMINSRDRDTQVFPQPAYLSIHLPRTYRNILSFQITQMKMLSSFFYFRPDKQNTFLDILEEGRTLLENGNTVDNVIRVTLRTGTYDINSLLTELQTQLNRTPLFYKFPNGFSDFVSQFTSTGDLSVSFNLPGDTYYNSLKGQFIPNPTIDTITNTYFPSRYSHLSTYTLTQVKSAYYYPVLYEMMVDPVYSVQLNTTLKTSSLLPGETVRSRVLYTFQGLDDPVIAELINNNLSVLMEDGQSLLDYYRSLNTFQYFLVNRYTCSYEPNNNRVNIISSQLNTSLTSLLDTQAQIALENELKRLKISPSTYSNLVTSNSQFTAVFGSMYSFVQSKFATYFAVNFGTYTPDFYTNISNAPFLRNGLYASGIATGYSLQTLQSTSNAISTTITPITMTRGYWPQISTMQATDVSKNVLFIGSGLPVQSTLNGGTWDPSYWNHPYDTYGKTILTSNTFIDNSGSFYTDNVLGAAQCLTPLYPSQYTVFRFRSYVRQTLQVETMGLPYYYRYPPLTAANYAAPIPQYFDLSYSYINSQQLTDTNLATPFTVEYLQPDRTNVYTTELTVLSQVRYLKFTAPHPTLNGTLLTDASGYKYPVRLLFECVPTGTTPSTNPQPDPILYSAVFDFFVYHDQGAFYADVRRYRTEADYHYNFTAASATDLSAVSFDINLVSGDTYYCILRSRTTAFQNTTLRAYVSFGSTTVPLVRFKYDLGISPTAAPTVSFPIVDGAQYNILYAKTYDPDCIHLPTAATVSPPDPSYTQFTQYLPISQPELIPIGYDISGVSDDLTDYRGWLLPTTGFYPDTVLSIDPTSGYTFQSLSPYSTSNSNYFYTGSSNAILAPYTRAPYTRKTVSKRQFKIVHWYDTNFLAPQRDQVALPSFNSNFLANADTFNTTNGTALDPFTYDLSGSSQGTVANGLNLGQGLCGYSFLPVGGIWEVHSFVFKTAYIEPSPIGSSLVDPNRLIAYIGIFPLSQIAGLTADMIHLSAAMGRLIFSSMTRYTPAEQTLNDGFDARGGTYWTFTQDPTFRNLTGRLINGFTPSTRYTNRLNDFYSLLPFDANGSLTPFYTPMGSYVPYPVVTSNVKVPYDPNSFNFLFNTQGQDYYSPGPYTQGHASNFYPLDCNSDSEAPYHSRYQLSMPIKTSPVQTLTPIPTLDTSNAYFEYVTNPTQAAHISQNAYTFSDSPNPILIFTKGPFMFWFDSPNLLTTNLIITSNLNQRSALSNVNIRGSALLYRGPLQTITRVGDYTPAVLSNNPTQTNSNICIGFTTSSNTSGTDSSGVYALFASKWPTRMYLYLKDNAFVEQYTHDFYVSAFTFDPTAAVAPHFSRVLVNSSGGDFQLGTASQLMGHHSDGNPYNAPIYTDNFKYTKFFYRTRVDTANPPFQSGLPPSYGTYGMVQFCSAGDHSTAMTTPPHSWIGLIQYTSGSPGSATVLAYEQFGRSRTATTYQNLRNCFCPNNYPANANGPTSPNVPFFWDSPLADPTATMAANYIYDWYFGEDGCVTTLYGNSTTALNLYRTWIPTSPTNNGSYVMYLNGSNFTDGINLPINPFNNTLAGDSRNNLYLANTCLPSLSNVWQYPTALAASNAGGGAWESSMLVSNNLAQISVSALSTLTQAFYTDAHSNAAEWSILQPTYHTSNTQTRTTLAASVLDTGFPALTTAFVNSVRWPYNIFIPQSLIVGEYVARPTFPSYYMQACDQQLITTPYWTVSISDPSINGISDIGGTYTIQFADNYTAYISNVPAGASYSALVSYITDANNTYITNNPSNYSSVPYNLTFMSHTASYALVLGPAMSNVTATIVSAQVFNVHTHETITPTIVYHNTTEAAAHAISFQSPPLIGSSGFGADVLYGRVDTAWQVMYPTMKIVLTQASANSATSITNTTDIVGSPPPPPDTYEHTALYYYTSYADLSNDLFNKFGSESVPRCKAYDISSGYDFHSYIYNIPLSAYTGSTSNPVPNVGYSYLAVRNYSPCEQSQVLTRFLLPERYDFGFISLKDLSDETQTVLVDLSGSILVNPAYQEVLRQFNNSFIGTFTFGSNAIAGFNGFTCDLTGWSSFIPLYKNTYATGSSNTLVLSAINSAVQSNMQTFIQTNLNGILPSYVLQRGRFTDPLLFSLQFKSSLSPEYADLEYEWGLGWNLGFPKADTEFDTIARATGFFKILDDYIYLRMNPEFSMNRLDTSGPEHYSQSHATTGQTNQFSAKLLLAPFGSYAQTMIQNPISFNPVVSSLDKLTFEWNDLAGTRISNTECEWNAAVQIVEQVTMAAPGSTIPKHVSKK